MSAGREAAGRLQPVAGPDGVARRIERFTLAIAVCVAIVWAVVALRVAMAGEPMSTNAVVACPALVLSGLALSMAVWSLPAARRKRQRRPRAEAILLREQGAMFLLTGLWFVGLAAQAVVDGPAGAWGWTSLVAWSVVGGVQLGLVVRISLDPARG